MDRKKDVTSHNEDWEVAKNIESTLLGLFILIGRMAYTFCDILVRPHHFSYTVLSSNPLDKKFPQQYVRPLSFFILCLALMLGGFLLLFESLKNSSINIYYNPLVSILIKAFKSGSINGIMIGASPIISILGLYAFSMAWVCRRRTVILTFSKSLFIAAYFAGSICLVYTIFIPIFSIFISLEVSKIRGAFPLMIILSIIGWSILLRSFYGYMILLKTSMKMTWASTINVVIRGTFVFFILFYMLLIWMAPLLSTLGSK